MEVGAAPVQFAGWVYLDPIRSADQSDEFALGKHASAADAGSLWNMSWTFGRFSRHLLIPLICHQEWVVFHQPLEITNLHRNRQYHVCVSW
jgi:hypothetical protein